MLKINKNTQFIYLGLVLFFWLEFAQAIENRLALVIGNSSYHGDFLGQMVTDDARNFAEALKKLNFRVIYKENLNRKSMQKVIQQFGKELNGGVGLFYFAGHGLQFEGENYLLPIGAEALFYRLDKKRLERKTTKVSSILKVMESAENRIIILDASRKNPFQNIGRGTTPEGLTQFKVPKGTLIASAAKPNKVVTKKNPYTKHLISEIQKPDLSITQVFLRVEAVVLNETGGQQESKSESKLKVDFYFAGKSDSWLIMLFGLVILLIGGLLVWRKWGEHKNVLKILSELISKLIQPKKYFKFNVITIDAQGNTKTDSISRQAQYYTENLGKGVMLEMVKIPNQPLYMGKYPVTQAQWQIIMGNNPSEFIGDNRPVTNVNYEMVQAFCEKLSKQTGKNYRLPTETEWESACSAGTNTPFHFGETITTDIANYDGDYTYASEPKGIDRKQTTEVGIFPPNAYGLYDMHGNVWEWTQGGIQRGGSWSNPPAVARTEYSLSKPTNKPKNNVGFRLVMESY